MQRSSAVFVLASWLSFVVAIWGVLGLQVPWNHRKAFVFGFIFPPLFAVLVLAIPRCMNSLRRIAGQCERSEQAERKHLLVIFASVQLVWVLAMTGLQLILIYARP